MTKRNFGWPVIAALAAVFAGCSPVANSDDNGNGAAAISGTLGADRVFSDTGVIYQVSNVRVEAKVTFAAKTRYVISGRIFIDGNGSLTIKPGCRLEFAAGAYLDVGESSVGTLIAEGTASDSIFFGPSAGGTVWGYGTGESSSGGIYIAAQSTSNTSLKYCSITKATTGVYAAAPGIAITNCAVTSCTYHGIYFESGGSPADSASFVGNSITGNGWYAISIPASAVQALSGTGTVAGNVKGGIFVRGSDVGENGVWKKHDAPYTVEGRINIGSASGNAITVRPGVVFEMNEGAYVDVGGSYTGTLIAEGTPADSIIFRSKVSGTNWGYGSSENSSGGIYIDQRSTSNTSLKYCSISKATTGVYADVAGIAVSNCRIDSCKYHGIYFSSGGSPGDSASFVNNTITDNGGYAISIEATFVHTLSGTGTVSGNGSGGILVRGNEVTATGAWKKHDAPYTIDGRVNIGSTGGNTVTIRPGAELELTPGSYLDVGESVPGTLIADGTAADSIFFRPKASGTEWGYGTSESSAGGIWIGAVAGNTSLKYCSIQKATNGVYVTDISPYIQNCRITACKFYGISIDLTSGATAANFANNDLAGNTMGDILQQ